MDLGGFRKFILVFPLNILLSITIPKYPGTRKAQNMKINSIELCGKVAIFNFPLFEKQQKGLRTNHEIT